MADKLCYITGITGFVGQNLEKYLSNTFQLKGVSRGKSPDRITYEEFFNSKGQYDTLIHLAGKAHDLKKVADENEYYEVNFELTKKLYDSFLKSNAKTFIYMSSVKAVKDNLDDLLTETVEATPITAYGKSKKMAEDYILSNMPAHKKVFVLRPCMIHGPGNKGNLNLLYKIVEKGIPWPLASFENKRSFLSIDNFNFLIHEMLANKDIASGVYNFSDDEALSTNELITLISETIGKRPKLWRISRGLIEKVAVLGDKIKLPLNSERLKKLTENYVVSNEKIKNALGINKLPVSAEEGLRSTINSFKK